MKIMLRGNVIQIGPCCTNFKEVQEVLQKLSEEELESLVKAMKVAKKEIKGASNYEKAS